MAFPNPNAKGLKSLFPVKNPTPVLVLSMDGGGIRSLLPLYALKYVEESIGLPISNIFDLVVATSTSSLVAAGLAMPNEGKSDEPLYSADDLLQVITASMPEIFTPRLPLDPYVTRPRFTTQSLQDFLEVFYPGSFKSSLTNLVLPTYDRNRGKMFIFRSWKEHSPVLELKDVLQAAVASPNYFPEVNMTVVDRDLRLVDGSFKAYNPIEVAIDESQNHFPGQPIVLLSLGSGMTKCDGRSKGGNRPNCTCHPKCVCRPIFVPRTSQSPVWGSPFLDRKIRVRGEGLHTLYTRERYCPQLECYERAQVELSREEDSLLSDFHEESQWAPSTLAVFENVGERYVKKNKDSLKNFCKFIKESWKVRKPSVEEKKNRQIRKEWRAGREKHPLDIYEIDDTENINEIKGEMVDYLKKNFVQHRDWKWRFICFKDHPRYKEMKKWMKMHSYEEAVSLLKKRSVGLFPSDPQVVLQVPDVLAGS